MFDKLYKNHKKYILFVTRFGNDSPEDIVQDVYLQILEGITPKHDDDRVNDDYKDLPTCQRLLDVNGEVNDIYMWILLRKKHQEQQSKLQVQRLGSYEVSEVFEEDYKLHEANYKLSSKVLNYIDRLHWYDKQIFNLYIKDKRSMQSTRGNGGLSMRDIAEMTGISLRSIQTTIGNVVQGIKNDLGEDFEDLINGDYNKI